MIHEPVRQSRNYRVRPFRPGDREGFLSLYETVFDRDRSAAWFRWKYEDNPYVDHVPIVVAERDGHLVGCRSLFALAMRVDGERRPALQPCDTMVHPDHRRQGLFTRMNERTLERYTGGRHQFFFNFPNEQSKPGDLKFDWEPIGTVPMYYRPQNPVSALRRWADRRLPVTGGDRDGLLLETVEDALAAPAVGTHRACDRLLANSLPAVRLERHDTPPASTLAAVSRRAVPEGIHAARTERFYRWRLANPAREYVTYVARRDGDPVAAVIVSPVEDHVRLIEALPRSIESERRALHRLLVAALSDHADREYVSGFGHVLPRPLRYRFFPDTRPPLSTLLSPTSRTLFAREAGGDVTVTGRSMQEWTLSWLDVDTA